MQATDMIEKVFQKHGAIKIATQLLIPKSQFYESNEGCVYLMDHTGTVLMLPYDSQVLILLNALESACINFSNQYYLHCIMIRTYLI